MEVAPAVAAHDFQLAIDGFHDVGGATNRQGLARMSNHARGASLQRVGGPIACYGATPQVKEGSSGDKKQAGSGAKGGQLQFEGLKVVSP